MLVHKDNISKREKRKKNTGEPKGTILGSFLLLNVWGEVLLLMVMPKSHWTIKNSTNIQRTSPNSLAIYKIRSVIVC